MSPGGKTPNSSRSRPEEPPSSATVTIAVMLSEYSLSPRRSVESPVPPPMATIFGPRRRERLWYMTSARFALGRSTSTTSEMTRLPPAATATTPRRKQKAAQPDSVGPGRRTS
ncbi:hypothetical protein D3C72_1007180 [compost metagenome]